MIKELFLPREIGSYIIGTERRWGIEVSKSHIRAVCMTLYGYTRHINAVIDISLDTDLSLSIEERTINGLKKLALDIKKNDIVCVALSTGQVVYKELILPFTDQQTISQVIEFEVEPLLPFSRDNALVDAIITQKLPDNTQSKVLAAATQKQYVAQIQALFNSADLTITSITTDIISLYNAYLLHPDYQKNTGGIVLIDLGMSATRLVYIFNSGLRLVRVLNQGVSACAKQLGQTMQIPTVQALEQMLRFGFDNTAHNAPFHESIIKACKQFWQSIQLTLDSFVSQQKQESIKTILILGEGIVIPGLASFMQQLFNIPCSSFTIAPLLLEQHITLDKSIKEVPSAHTIALGAAISTPLTEHFTLLRKEFAPTRTPVVMRQVITLGTLLTLLFGGLIGFYIFRNLRLSHHIANLETMVFDELNTRFPGRTFEGTLEEAINDADQELQRQKRLWLAYTARPDYLRYWSELASTINRKLLGLDLEQLTMTPEGVTLRGRVRDANARQLLLKSIQEMKSFELQQKIQNWDPFEIKLTITSTKAKR